MTRRGRYIEVLAVTMLLLVGAGLRYRLVQPKWAFAGSDSYGYLKLGNELFADGRFSLGPTEPLDWYRRPLYPVFLRLARGSAPAEMSGGAGWRRIQLAQALVDLSAALVLYLAARKLAGRLAAFVTISLALYFPPSAVWFAAALTECLSMALTVAAIAPLIWLRERPIWAASLSGLGVGLASLLRPDGPLLAVALVPALFLVGDWAIRRRIATAFLTVYLVVFGAWPARNLLRFGKLHLADGMIDRYGHDVPHYRGFRRWMQTWALNEHPAEFPQACFYDLGCRASTDLFSPQDGAFLPNDLPDERARVDALLKLRERSGLTKQASDGFLLLAVERRKLHPLRTDVSLPFVRALRMWTSPQDEILSNPGWRPWSRVISPLLPWFRFFARAQLALLLIGAAVLLRQRATRVVAGVFLLPILVRTAVLGWTAFSLPRYLLGIYPLCFLVIGVGTSVLAIRVLKRSERADVKLQRDSRV